MSTTLYRDTGAPLIGLIEDIRTGRVALPDIQRPFVWASKKVRDLFDLSLIHISEPTRPY